MRMRVTVRSTGDRTKDLMMAAAIRDRVWAQVPVEIDPDYPLHGTHRDEKGRAYFEFATDFPNKVRQIVSQDELIELSEVREGFGEECVKCGNVAGEVLPPVCPNCGFRDISPCPNCKNLIARKKYIPLDDGHFRCPTCRRRVRLHFIEPLFVADGEYNQPLVIVEGITVDHEI
jgi:hypothetical protein